MVSNKDTRAPLEPPGKNGPYLVARAQENGLIIRALGDRVAFSPPLIISATEIDAMFDRFAKALDETADWVSSQY
jgi:4-aminobutyrate--pyruvate transaminase